MKWSVLCLIVLVLLSFGAMKAFGGKVEWEKGENRIPNPDFEDDGKGIPPTGWTLEDGT